MLVGLTVGKLDQSSDEGTLSFQRPVVVCLIQKQTACFVSCLVAEPQSQSFENSESRSRTVFTDSFVHSEYIIVAYIINLSFIISNKIIIKIKLETQEETD